MERSRDKAASADMERRADPAPAAGSSVEQCYIPNDRRRAGKAWLSSYASAMSGKIKALKKKYKFIANRLRRSGAGRESDEESDLPSDFPYFEIMDAIMGGRAVVTLVHLLNSAASNSPSIVEAEGEDDATTEALSQPTTSDPATLQSTHNGPQFCLLVCVKSCILSPG